MFCANCGSQIGDRDKFCPGCGKAVNTATEPKATTFAQNQTVVHCATYSARPITYESRLVPILRHPLFFISAVIFLAVSIYDFISWLPALSYFLTDLQNHIIDVIRVFALLGSNLLFLIGLILLVIGGLTKNRSPIGAALSLNVIALCLQLLAQVINMVFLLDNAFFFFDDFEFYTHSYPVMLYFLANLAFVIPVTFLMLIFALRANGIARAMNNGQDRTIGSGPAIMLLLYALVMLITDSYSTYSSGHSWIYFMENYGVFLLPAISFGILLLLKRKNKQ